MIYNNIAHDNDGGGFAIGGQNSIVVGNKAYNNGRGRHGYGGFVARVNPATRNERVSFGLYWKCGIRQPLSQYDATQDYGYVEQGRGLSDIKQIGNDYNRNRIGPPSRKNFSTAEQIPISSDHEK